MITKDHKSLMKIELKKIKVEKFQSKEISVGKFLSRGKFKARIIILIIQVNQ